MQGLFERSILDEAHEIRHASKEMGTAALWLMADYRIAITATPILSGIKELSGIMKYLQDPRLHEVATLRRQGFEATGQTAFEDTIDNFGPWTVGEYDPRSSLKFTAEALDKWVFGRDLSISEQGTRVTAVLKDIMIRRTYASVVHGKRIGDALPEVQHLVFQCEFTPIERTYYDNIYGAAARDLYQKNMLARIREYPRARTPIAGFA